jgi:hypothetical protein
MEMVRLKQVLTPKVPGITEWFKLPWSAKALESVLVATETFVTLHEDSKIYEDINTYVDGDKCFLAIIDTGLISGREKEKKRMLAAIRTADSLTFTNLNDDLMETIVCFKVVG